MERHLLLYFRNEINLPNYYMLESDVVLREATCPGQPAPGHYGCPIDLILASYGSSNVHFCALEGLLP